ncbi:porin family protein [Pontibacter rugosus]|uniref:Porin family protein n=1 Tax=Pontibacter rugosus TaxID=1745966 RepID=A0ABW3SPF8_9BACT
MKKLLLSLTIALATFGMAQAQSGLGIRGGANLSNVEGDLQNEDLYKNKFGFHAGITLGIPVVENFFYVQPELLYSTKGFKYDDSEYTINNLSYRNEGKINSAYIDLPVLAKITAGPIYFEAGPQASYLLSMKDETRVYLNDDLVTSSTTELDRDNMKKFELGYVAGVGFTTGGRFSIGVRYNGSFNDFVDDTPDNYFGEENVRNARNSVFMLTVGLSLTK